jgi:hypothetical protein
LLILSFLNISKGKEFLPWYDKSIFPYLEFVFS